MCHIYFLLKATLGFKPRTHPFAGDRSITELCSHYNYVVLSLSHFNYKLNLFYFLDSEFLSDVADRYPTATRDATTITPKILHFVSRLST